MNELQTIQAELRAMMDARDWERFHDPKNLAMCVASEAGELVAELRWVANADADAWCREPDQRGRLADEVADVAISLLLLCDRIGLDLPAAIRQKMKKIDAKYPVELVRGKSDRPQDLAPAPEESR